MKMKLTWNEVEDVVFGCLYLITLEYSPIDLQGIRAKVKGIGIRKLRSRLTTEATVKLCNHLK